MRGDEPVLLVDDPGARVTEIIKVFAQPVVGKSTYSTIIKELSLDKDCHIRASL